MKKLIAFIVLIISVSVSMYAQEPIFSHKDVEIHLKNDSIAVGKIIGQVPGKAYIIKNDDKEILTFNYEDIVYIGDWKRKREHKWNIDMGYSYDYVFNKSVIAADVAYLFDIHRRWYCGPGIGINYYAGCKASVPVYGELRYTSLNKKTRFIWGTKVGVNIPLTASECESSYIIWDRPDDRGTLHYHDCPYTESSMFGCYNSVYFGVSVPVKNHRMTCTIYNDWVYKFDMSTWSAIPFTTGIRIGLQF